MEFSQRDFGRQWIQASLPFDYRMRAAPGGESPEEVIILLHGFAESGERIFSKLEPVLPTRALVLAPNAVFPMAHKNAAGEYKMVHAWYFYDPGSKQYVIDMRVALDYLATGLKTLGLAHLPKRIIGFSQGGYLAPFAALRLGNVRQVVGVACEYLVEELFSELKAGEQAPFRIDGVHGALDEIVQLEESRLSHAELAHQGIEGEFVVLEKSAHRFDPAIAEAVKTLLGRAPRNTDGA